MGRTICVRKESKNDLPRPKRSRQPVSLLPISPSRVDRKRKGHAMSYCRFCPPGCKSCEPDDCECYTHQDEPDKMSNSIYAPAEIIWNASRNDEGTISATGAKIVAQAIINSSFIAQVQAEAWDSEPVIHLDPETLLPVSVSKPCPSTTFAYLGFQVPGLTSVRVPCGNLAGHEGPHVFHVQWSDPHREEGIKK